ncbi:hypothetical protein ACHAWF_009800 [Thalassiosira exigua]
MRASATTIAVLAGAAAPAAATQPTFPVAQPGFRYEPFHKLDSTSKNIAEEKLGYQEVTWNVHGLAPIEKKGWTALTSNERDAASVLGFVQGTWDCFINHYQQYEWDELAAKGVQEHYRQLGWTQEFWEHDVDGVPYTEARWWDLLTENEKKAANALCYFEDNWDKKDMNPNPTFFPHPMPMFRYKPWDQLDSVTKNVAQGMLNYTEELWNDFGSAVVEKNTFLNLDNVAREGALDLGFYTHTWDCFMNHYLSYYWSSFHEDLRIAVETLGWTEAMWENGEESPLSEGKVWIDLTPEEKAAATRLCYFREIWDDEPITNWYDYGAGKNTAVTGEGPVPKDIDLDIFEETGYVGKAPGSVGLTVYTATDTSSSHRAVVTSGVMALAASVGAFLLL